MNIEICIVSHVGDGMPMVKPLISVPKRTKIQLDALQRRGSRPVGLFGGCLRRSSSIQGKHSRERVMSMSTPDVQGVPASGRSLGRLTSHVNNPDQQNDATDRNVTQAEE